MLIERLDVFTPFAIRKLTVDDAREVFLLEKEYEDFQQLFKTGPLTQEDVERDFTVLPEQGSREQKFDLGFYQDGKLAAFADLQLGYPNPQTIWLGTLMVVKDHLREKIGSRIIAGLKQAGIREGYKVIALANPVENTGAEAFLKQAGFAPLGIQEVLPRADAPAKIKVRIWLAPLEK